jgi:photosystem II stability/assembly factor-like uncharacterized protein
MKMSLGRVLAFGAVPVMLLAVGAGSASARPGSGTPPPPAGFEVQSASFVSAQNGFVLGARHCSILPCRALLERTTNGGKSWTKVTAPAVELQPRFTGAPASAVSSVRFENTKDGWLYGPSLWATTNGGRTWHRVHQVPNAVTNLAAADGEVFAVSQPLTGGSSQARLYKSAVGSGKWSLVRRVAPQTTLTVFGHSVWTGLAPAIWTSANSGKTWSKLSFECPASYPAASEVAAASAKDVAIACSDQGDPQPGLSYKKVFVSSNGGKTFHVVKSQPGIPGQVYGLAMPAGRPNVITINAASGASYFYRTVNSGKTWATNTFDDGGLGFNDLAYVTGTTGYVVHFMGTPYIAYGDGLMKTVNAGHSWTSVSIH